MRRYTKDGSSVYLGNSTDEETQMSLANEETQMSWHEEETQMSLDVHSRSRSLLWGKKKRKKAFKAFVPKNGIELELAGDASYDFYTKEFNAGFSISGKFCIMSICSAVSISVET